MPSIAPFIKNSWLVVDTLEQLKPAGIKSYTIADRNFVLWIHKDTIVAMDDACPHRGARLSNGIVIDDAIECPYHGLRFDQNGTCVKAPSDGGFSSPRLRCSTYPTKQWRGLVLIYLGEEQQPFRPPPIPPRDIETTICGPYQIDAKATDIIENFIDVAHLPFVHRDVLGTPQYAKVEPFDVIWKDGRLSSSTIRVFQPNPSGDGSADTATYTYELTSPLCAYFQKEFSDEQYAATIFVTPVLGKKCVAWLVVHHDNKHSPASIKAFQNEIMGQDQIILEALQTTPINTKPTFFALPSDALIVAYRKWLGEYRQ